MHYLVSRINNEKEVICVNYKNGYKITPRNQIRYEGIVVNELVIVKSSLIEKLIKRKIKTKLDYFLSFIIDDTDDDTRKALDELERYKTVIRAKYALFLDNKYLELLDKKISLLENELKNICLSKTPDEEVEEIGTKSR